MPRCDWQVSSQVKGQREVTLSWPVNELTFEATPPHQSHDLATNNEAVGVDPDEEIMKSAACGRAALSRRTNSSLFISVGGSAVIVK